MLKLLLCLSLPLYVLDQVTKFWILHKFPEGETPLGLETPVIDGFFWLHRLHNTGVAWGSFNGAWWANYVFGAVSLTALVFLSIMWKNGAFPTKAGKTAVGLLVAGVLGNLTDRLLHGYVVDFLRFDLKFTMWPSFNVADSCICVAAGLLFISAWQAPGETKKETEEEDKTQPKGP